MHIPFVAELSTKFDVVTQVGRSVYGLPSQESGVSAVPNFGGFVHPLTENDEIRHGNTWEECVFRKSGTLLHLHKYVAQFVSDS